MKYAAAALLFATMIVCGQEPPPAKEKGKESAPKEKELTVADIPEKRLRLFDESERLQHKAVVAIESLRAKCQARIDVAKKRTDIDRPSALRELELELFNYNARLATLQERHGPFYSDMSLPMTVGSVGVLV